MAKMRFGFVPGFGCASVVLFCIVHVSVSSRDGGIAWLDLDNLRMGAICAMAHNVFAGTDTVRHVDDDARAVQGIRRIPLFRFNSNRVERVDRFFEFDGRLECGLWS